MYCKFRSPTCFTHEIFFNLSPTIFQAMLCFFCLLLSALKIWAEDFSWYSPPLFMTWLLLRIMPNKRSTWTNIDLSLYWKVCLLCKAIHHTNYICVSIRWKALRGRKIYNCIELWCLMGSGGVDFCVSSTSFQKSTVGWPQQSPTERVSNISEKLDFLWSIQQKGTGIGYLGTRDDAMIMLSIFWWNEAVEVIEATEVVEAIEAI